MTYDSSIVRADVDSIIPTEYSNEFVNAVADSSYVLRMARRLRNMSRYQQTMPVLSALATAYFVSGETGLKQTSEVNWEDKTITAEEVACIIPVAEQTLADSSIDLWAEIKNELVTALGVVIDNAILYGTNAPASWPDDIYTAAAAASNTVELGTGADAYEDIMSEGGLLEKVELDGYEVSGHLAYLGMKSVLRGLRDSEGQPIFVKDMRERQSYYLDGTPLLFPKNGVGSSSYPMFSGDWNQLVYSMRQDMTYKVATEGVIQDANGDIQVNLFQQDMVALRVTMRLGWQLPNPINRVNTSSTTRYPFAVLTDLS